MNPTTPQTVSASKTDLRQELSVSGPPTDPVAKEGAIQTRQPVLVHQVLVALGLALTFIAYCGTLGFEFAYDDRSQVVGNPWIRSWRFAPHYFTKSVWGFHNPYVFGNYYRPLFFVWLRLNHMLFGLKPWGWHLTSVLAHLGVTVLVYYLASRILRDRLTGAVAATIFGVHPVHIESVAWVSGVPEPLLAMLLISAFLCYLKSEQHGRRSRAWLARSVLLYCAAMFAKETAVVFPLLLIAYESIFSSPAAGTTSFGTQVIRVRNALRCAVPYLVPVPVYLAIRAVVLQGFSHAVTPLPFSTLFFTWPSLLWFYIKLLAWPVGLSPCYETPYVTGPGLLGFFLPVAGLAGVGIILWVWARSTARDHFRTLGIPKSRAIAFASVWIVVPILPSFELSVFLRGDIAHDRYVYLSSVGFALLVALALREVGRGRWKLYGQSVVQAAVALALVLALALGTVFQSLMWADDLLLYSRGVKVCPSNRNVKMNLGIVACERGFYDAGMKLFREVIQEYPNFWIAYYNLGYTYYKLGNLEEADRYLTRATEVDLFAAHAYLYLGLTRMKMGRLNDAQALLRHAAQAAPVGAPLYHFALGLAMKAQGDLRGALEEFKTELLIDPEEQAARDQIIEIEARLASNRK